MSSQAVSVRSNHRARPQPEDEHRHGLRRADQADRDTGPGDAQHKQHLTDVLQPRTRLGDLLPGEEEPEPPCPQRLEDRVPRSTRRRGHTDLYPSSDAKISAPAPVMGPPVCASVTSAPATCALARPWIWRIASIT